MKVLDPNNPTHFWGAIVRKNITKVWRKNYSWTKRNPNLLTTGGQCYNREPPWCHTTLLMHWLTNFKDILVPQEACNYKSPVRKVNESQNGLAQRELSNSFWDSGWWETHHLSCHSLAQNPGRSHRVATRPTCNIAQGPLKISQAVLQSSLKQLLWPVIWRFLPVPKSTYRPGL